MAAEASRAGCAVASYQQVGSNGGFQGASESQHSQCGRRTPVASGHHCELHCGHAFCELCLLVTEEYSTIKCPDCEVATTLNMRPGYYSVDGCIEEDSSVKELQPKMRKNCSPDFKKTVDQLIVGLEHSASLHRTVLNPSAVMSENKTTEEIDEALKIAGYNFEQLSIAIKMLEHTQHQAREERDSLIEVVDKQFNKLFASLDSRKKNLCEELTRSTDDYLSDLIMVKSYIEGKKNDLDAAMKIAKELKSAPSLRTYCDLTQIIRTLKVTFESELSQVSSVIPRNPPRLNMNCSEIICMFNNMGKIEFEDPTKCYPQENEVGQNVQKKCNKKKELSGDTYSSIEKRKVDMSVLTNEAQILPLQPETKDMHAKGKSIQPQKEMVVVTSPKTIAVLPQVGSSPDVIIEEIIEENLECCPELVFVSHVIHPCHFYVRKYSQIKAATILEKKLNQICNKSLHLDPSDVLELGARIFVNSFVHGMWCRGTITELIPLNKNIGKSCNPTKFSVCEIALIKIFMVDFGNSEVLIVTGGDDAHMKPEYITEQHITLNDLCLVLRKSEPCSEELLKDIPPLAHPCSLKDIVPHNSNEGWEREAKVEFLKMVNKKAVLMKVFREEGDVLIVDLQKPPTNKISSDMPVSLRDALVFIELARFRSQSPRSPSEKNTPLRYTPPILPEEMTDISIMVCHINSPGDFYLQLIENLDFLSLLKAIEEFYKGEDGENLEILCPVQDQACVAQFEDGIWYRAKVTGLPGHREVEVKYVDFGNTAKITLKEMRKIKDEFLEPPEKAIKCKLAYIEPCKRTAKWSKKAKEKFEEMTQDKFLTCSVIKILEDNVLLVELFDSQTPGMTPTSINDQLVKEGLASYEVGYTLKDNSKKHLEVWDASPEEIISNEINNLSPISVKSLPNDNFQSFYNKELPVHICNVISPQKIHVQWLLTENLLNSLEEKMIAAYENSEWEPIKWESDMHCAVKVPDKNQWRRGQIIRMVTDTLVEVLLYDVGFEIVVNIHCLRELQENLRTMGRLSLECSLVDIRPTGGSDKWTATACDCLSLYLTGALATIILQVSSGENSTTWPLPVKIFCRDEKGERVDVSKYLIKKGLALRERRINKSTNNHSSQKSLEQGDSVVTTCIEANFNSDKKAADIIKEYKVHELKEKLSETRPTGYYKPPAIPNVNTFEAIVSCIGDDGTIFIVPKSSEFELIKMMSEIQSNLKCLGLLEPYFWTKGEPCAVRGSDTMWYRGKVIEVVGGSIQVQYLDHGFTEKIPQCHLYPILLYPDTPQFCIPCQLHHTIPVGNVWQPDAIELLQELLSKREVDVHIMELPENPWGKLSVHLYFDGMSLSHFMAHHKYCTFEHAEEIFKEKPTDDSMKYEYERWEIKFEELLLSGTETLILPSYLSSFLPPPEELYAVQVKHVVSPNEVYICLESVESCNQFNHSDTDASGVIWESEPESLEEALQRFNKNVETFPPLTDFSTEMPCLAEYADGLWYRAKIVSIKEFNPLSVLVLFVDYGSTEKLTINRLRQIPLQLMQYPARAIKVLLAGFKPPLCDSGKARIPYCPKWSMEALWAIIDCLQGKKLYASSMAQAPEPAVTLYEDKQYPVHMSLVEMGLADKDE
uniref:RING finger protein 17 isoform X1 n=1 Tax=Jaculus jaculus TaxID=51337 RepID=UPI001E1AFA22|nr:RING finger protein 17 isoform X1 [Jaculus jaculus]